MSGHGPIRNALSCRGRDVRSCRGRDVRSCRSEEGTSNIAAPRATAAHDYRSSSDVRMRDAADVYQQVLITRWTKVARVPGDEEAALCWMLAVARRHFANQPADASGALKAQPDSRIPYGPRRERRAFSPFEGSTTVALAACR